MFIRDFTVAVVVGTILLFLLSKLVGRVQFSVSTAFWCSLIGHALLSVSTLITGVIFSRQLSLALIFGLGVGCLLQAGLFQVAVRAKSETITASRAVVLSLIVILGGFFVASPIIEFGGRGLKHVVSALSNGNAYLLIAIGLAVIYSMLKPLSDGLFDTSIWVAKILAPSDAEENATTEQFLRFGQASLMEGWLSNVPFITTMVWCLSVISGFVYHWWAGILILLVSVALGALTKILWTRPAPYYLAFLYHKMINRVADYRRDGDLERLEASESLCEDLQHIMCLYQSSRLRPPTPKQVMNIPYGDLAYWLECGSGRA